MDPVFKEALAMTKEAAKAQVDLLGSKVSAHTPEPWVCYSHRGTIINPSAATIALVGDFLVARDGQSYEFHGSDEQDARRIVACVNACIGIPTDDLEQTRGFITASDLREQRDELAEALRELVACKDLKDRIEWLNDAAKRGRLIDDESEELEISTAQYEQRKPIAWAASRAAIAKLDTDSTKGAAS